MNIEQKNSIVLRNEKEILESWNVDKDYSPFVLIRCNVFNHANYIETAIHGFLSQITTFPFKIQIHDDASTDGSQAIIEKYYNQYPNIIIPIFEEKNLWSRKDGSLTRVVQENKDGKYIALCEGDDYWINPYKLESQIAILEKNTDCYFCFTNGYIEDQRTGKNREDYFGDSDYFEITKKDHIFSLDDAYKISFPPTASYVYLHEFEENLNNVPRCPNGDLRKRAFFMTLGGAYYWAEKTCVYRKCVPNSTMDRWSKEKRAECYCRSLQVIDMLNTIDEMTNYEHCNGIFKLKKRHIDAALENGNGLNVLWKEDLKKVFRGYSFIHKCTVCLKLLIPDIILDKAKEWKMRL